MDLTNLENALNNGNFKEQVYYSLQGIYQISNVLDQLDLLKNFSERDLEIVRKIQVIKRALAGYETSEQELKAKIQALVNSLEAMKQELEARLNMNMEIQSAGVMQKLNDAGNALKTQLINELKEAKDNLAQELKAKIQALMNSLEAMKQKLEAHLNMLQSVGSIVMQKLNDAGNALKTQLINELKEAKDNLAQELKPQIQGATKFLGIYIYGKQKYFINQSDNFMELFDFANMHLQANKNYIVQFSMPYELSTNGIYSDSMGEMVLCLKANNKVYPIINSFYQNKTTNLTASNKIIDAYRVNSSFKTPSEEADYKIAVFARKHKDLWVNVNYTSNTEGFELSFLNNASFANLTTQSLPTNYNNDWVFYKHSQAIVYEILE
ncbi:apolipoprotein A1/A4/E domain-containing protein [Helicobacter pylori]|uniref:apolipoprotein A1/A4/E domain-containing protein n=1 Tax=Helicobacter pylori TaxID=210 RepID=UPI000EAD6C84|nr:apolipoprotein A1/A4/E domain-containing protein [Helicobacter pylori]